MSKTVPLLVVALAAVVAAVLAPAATAQVSRACMQAAPIQAGPQLPRICRSAAELNELLRSGYRGRVIIPRDAKWEMKGYEGEPLTYIPLHSGVELVGERGALGSRPLLYADYRAEDYPLFVAEKADDVRVEGLHLRGPYRPRDRKKELANVRAIEVMQDSVSGAGRRVVVADNEIEGFRDAVVIAGTIAKDEPDGLPGGLRLPGPRLAGRPPRPDARAGGAQPPPQQRHGGGWLRSGRRRRRLRHGRGQRVRLQQSLRRRGRTGLQRLLGSLQLRPARGAHLREGRHVPPQLRRARKRTGEGRQVRRRSRRHLLRRLLQHRPR